MKRAIILLSILLILFACQKKVEIKPSPVYQPQPKFEAPTVVFKKTLPAEKAPVQKVVEEEKKMCNIRLDNIPEANEIDIYFDEKRVKKIPGYLVCDSATNYLYKVLVKEKEKLLPCNIKLPEKAQDLIKFLADNKLVKDESEKCLDGCMKGVLPGRCNPPSCKQRNIRGECIIGRAKR
ncbi:hypothetical protein HYV79_03055 [Candidatus Woesearchaeota archaeon]|nr:hypothetical protein [Candidatus Woesearchaeota archaeon]